MRQELELPSLVLHSLSSGFSVEDPAVSSVAFFNFFHGMRPEVKYVGLFAPPFVPTEDYESIKSAPGVVKARGRTEVATGVAGTVQAILARPGLPVVRGQPQGKRRDGKRALDRPGDVAGQQRPGTLAPVDPQHHGIIVGRPNLSMVFLSHRKGAMEKSSIVPLQTSYY